MSTRERILMGLALLIVLADWAQPLLLPWKGKFFGAIAGGLIYAVVALGAYRGWKPTRWVAMVMPLIPTVTLVLHGVGAPIPVQPDAAMVGIYGLQLAVALSAFLVRRESLIRESEELPG